MRPEDYRRFKPELWLQDHNPNPVPFNDLAVLQSELELRRRREIYRQSSQRRTGEYLGQNFAEWLSFLKESCGHGSSVSRVS